MRYVNLKFETFNLGLVHRPVVHFYMYIVFCKINILLKLSKDESEI